MKMKFWICLMMLVPSAAGILDMSGKMFTFPEETNTAHVRLSPRPTRYTAITVCHRSFTDLKRDHALLSLATPSAHNGFLIFMNIAKKQMTAYIQNVDVGYGGLDYAPNKWYSICTTWDSNSGLAQMWFNGQPLVKKYATESAITELPIIVLGQEQDGYGGGFDAKQSFVGMMTDVHMWDYVLSSCEIKKFMEEQNFTPGNVLNWAALDLKITGRVLIENKQTGCDLDLDQESNPVFNS